MLPPDDLSLSASEVWLHTTAEHKHLNEGHRDLLRAYCESVARHNQACKSLADLPSLLVDSTKGTPMIAPEVRLARDEAVSLRQLAHELQITPASQGEIMVEVEDELAKLKQRRADLSA